MHKMILTFFKFLKESAEFMKILVLLGITLFLLYWIEHLIGGNWSWNNFIEPLLML